LLLTDDALPGVFGCFFALLEARAAADFVLLVGVFGGFFFVELFFEVNRAGRLAAEALT